MQRNRLLALAAAVLVGSHAAAAETVRPLPFSDDRQPPAPLPEPLDRRFHGELTSFDGVRIGLRWDWSAPEQLQDFDAFVPVRYGLTGGFALADGRLAARGTGGLRLRLGMLDDLALRVDAHLIDPHDLGIVLPKPGSSDESVVCLVQDRYFTRFDAAAGNSTMINKVGGIPATAPGVTEFRYVARSPVPQLDRGADVRFEVVRKGDHTTFVITAADGPTTLAGKDTDTPMTRFTPGLYVSGGAATFGTLEIEGAIDTEWCRLHEVLPHVAGNLLHPGNRFKGKDRKAAENVESFCAETAETPEKKRVAPKLVAGYVGDESLPLVIRIRAAEALTAAGGAAGAVADRVAELLDAKDRPGRLLAWQVLRPQLPWHFRYDIDGEPKARREAALLVGQYLRDRDDQEAQGMVYVEGAWYTPSRADAVRAEWDHAWDLRTQHVRVRTNLTREWADWYLAALEAEYAQLVEVIGREPPPELLPLNVLVFRSADDFTAFCKANGYEDKAAWGRFTDVDRGTSFVTFAKRDAPFWALGQMAKLFLERATGRHWPTWFAEGRASYFGNPTYGTATWDGTTLTVGRRIGGSEAQMLRAAAAANEIEPVADFLARDPRVLDGPARRRWYVVAWALHHWFVREAPEDLAARFGTWQRAMESADATPRDVDLEGRTLFLQVFSGRLDDVDAGFRAWLRGL